MPIPFACPHCSLETLADDEFSGQSGACAGCGKQITVPFIPDAGLRPDEVIVGIPSSGRKSALSIFLIVLGAVAAGAVGIALLIALLFPAIGAARSAAYKHTCVSNLQRIADALQAYELEYGSLPPAYLADANGKPMHSWRVMLLPFLGEPGLFAQYDFNQPWDGPQNVLLQKRMPAVYACPADPDARMLGESNYMVVVGSDTLFPGASARATIQIGDPLETTLAIVESPVLGTPWTQPQELNVEKMQFAINGEFGKEIGSSHVRGAHVLMADGNVRFLSDILPADYVEGMTTINGGEPIPAEAID